jgi:hypothetical protein
MAIDTYRNPERFPAGTRADPQTFNEWTRRVVELQQAAVRSFDERLFELERVQSMAAVQAWFPPLGWNTPTADVLRTRGRYLAGNAQHDVRYAQIIQPLSTWKPRATQRLLLSRPYAEGGQKTWQEAGDLAPYGVISEALDGLNHVSAQVLIETERVCNCLVWEPYPAWFFDLERVVLLTRAGEVNVDLTHTVREYHGPQRFFFPDTEVWGAEVELSGEASILDNLIVAGCWRFDLAYCAAQSGVSFQYRLSDADPLSAAAAHGQGQWSVTPNSPSAGVVSVELFTPADAPTSVVRQFSWS